MITHDDDHARFRSQLADHLLDLLDEQENAVLESHARHCPDCGRLLAAARRERADWWEGTGHPPVGLLAAEPLDERVRLHVSGCADCRDEVALLSGAVVDPAPGRPTCFHPWPPSTRSMPSASPGGAPTASPLPVV